MEIQRAGPQRVELRLSYSEAIVLNEVLGRLEWAGILDSEEFWSDPTEQAVLWGLRSKLDTVIDESGTDAYSSAVNDAWSRIRNSDER